MLLGQGVRVPLSQLYVDVVLGQLLGGHPREALKSQICAFSAMPTPCHQKKNLRSQGPSTFAERLRGSLPCRGLGINSQKLGPS